MTIKINDLFILVTKDMDGKPDIYPRIFINKEEAEKLAKEFNMVIKSCFINN